MLCGSGERHAPDILDTRGKEPFASGHIPGALCASMEELEQLITLLPKDREVVAYCWGHD